MNMKVTPVRPNRVFLLTASVHQFFRIYLSTYDLMQCVSKRNRVDRAELKVVNFNTSLQRQIWCLGKSGLRATYKVWGSPHVLCIEWKAKGGSVSVEVAGVLGKAAPDSLLGSVTAFQQHITLSREAKLAANETKQRKHTTSPNAKVVVVISRWRRPLLTFAQWFVSHHIKLSDALFTSQGFCLIRRKSSPNPEGRIGTVATNYDHYQTVEPWKVNESSPIETK